MYLLRFCTRENYFFHKYLKQIHIFHTHHYEWITTNNIIFNLSPKLFQTRHSFLFFIRGSFTRSFRYWKHSSRHQSYIIIFILPLCYSIRKKTQSLSLIAKQQPPHSSTLVPNYTKKKLKTAHLPTSSLPLRIYDSTVNDSKTAEEDIFKARGRQWWWDTQARFTVHRVMEQTYTCHIIKPKCPPTPRSGCPLLYPLVMLGPLAKNNGVLEAFTPVPLNVLFFIKALRAFRDTWFWPTPYIRTHWLRTRSDLMNGCLEITRVLLLLLSGLKMCRIVYIIILCVNLIKYILLVYISLFFI